MPQVVLKSLSRPGLESGGRLWRERRDSAAAARTRGGDGPFFFFFCLEGLYSGTTEGFS